MRAPTTGDLNHALNALKAHGVSEVGDMPVSELMRIVLGPDSSASERRMAQWLITLRAQRLPAPRPTYDLAREAQCHVSELVYAVGRGDADVAIEHARSAALTLLYVLDDYQNDLVAHLQAERDLRAGQRRNLSEYPPGVGHGKAES